MTVPDATDWIDVSVTVRHGMPHWPDNPPIVLERAMDIGQGDGCNLSRLAMGVHSGTHMDAPLHFVHGAAGLDQMPLTATMGEARVVVIEDPQCVLRTQVAIGGDGDNVPIVIAIGLNQLQRLGIDHRRQQF